MTSAGALALSAGLEAVAAGAFLFAGYRTLRREVSAPAAFASHAFALWWYCVAAQSLLSATQTTLYLLGVTDLPLHATLRHGKLLVSCVALWGLSYYLLYIFFGRRNLYIPLAFAYLAAFVITTGLYVNTPPTGLVARAWGVETVPAGGLTGLPYLALLVLFVAPPFLGSIAYLTLFFRVEDPVQRFRILLISLTLLVWISSAALGRLLSDDLLMTVARGFLGTLTATAVVAAYSPPEWVRRRWSGGQAPAAP